MNAMKLRELVDKLDLISENIDEKSPEWSEFEKVIAEVYETMGYKVDHHIHVFGSAPRLWDLPQFEIDVLAVQSLGLHPFRMIVECKYWSKNVTPNIIRSFKDTLYSVQYEKAVIISNKNFTKESFIEAADSNIQLITKSMLLDFLRFNILLHEYIQYNNINSEEKNILENVVGEKRSLLACIDFHNNERFKRKQEKYQELLGNMIDYAKKRELFKNGFSVELLIYYGELHRRVSLELSKAEKLLNEAIKKIDEGSNHLKRFEGRALYELAYVYYLKNNFQKAGEIFIRSGEADGKRGRIAGKKMSYTQAGVAYLKNGEFGEAYRHISNALEFFRASPHDIDCIRWKGSCLCHLAKICLLNPEYGTLASVLKMIEDAKTIFQHLKIPTWVMDNLEGLYHFKNRNFNQAIKCFSKIIKEFNHQKLIIEEEFAEVFCARGRAYEKNRQKIKARQDYDSAIKRCPVQRANLLAHLVVKFFRDGKDVPENQPYALALKELFK